jgi:hypothetical protein
MHHFAVTITFNDETFRCTAWCASRERAYDLALIDARLQRYYGKVVRWEAVDITPDEIPCHIKARFNAGRQKH